MKIFEETDNGVTRQIGWANPTFDNNTQTMTLWLNKGMQQKIDGNYETMSEYTKLNYRQLSLNNETYVLPTGEIYKGSNEDRPQNAIPGWLWIAGTTLGQMTENNPQSSDYVFQLIAQRIEDYISINQEW